MKPRYRMTIVPDGHYTAGDLSHYALHRWGASLFREDIWNRVIKFGIAGFQTCMGYKTN